MGGVGRDKWPNSANILMYMDLFPTQLVRHMKDNCITFHIRWSKGLCDTSKTTNRSCLSSRVSKIIQSSLTIAQKQLSN